MSQSIAAPKRKGNLASLPSQLRDVGSARGHERTSDVSRGDPPFVWRALRGAATLMSPRVRSALGRCCRKSLLGGNKQDFLKLLMGFVRSDVRDHIASQKNDHGPSYRHYRASQRRGSPKFTICEIFGVVRFSTFSTASVNRVGFGSPDECPLYPEERRES